MKLPIGWIKTKIGEICNVVRGGSPRPMGDPKYFNGSIPFLKIADITKIKGNTVYDSIIHVNNEGAKKSRLIKKGNLILTNSGTVCVPKFLGVDACIHDGFVSFLDLSKSVSKKYLFHFFNYIRPRIIQENRQGITQVNLNIAIVSNINLHLPPLPEQHRIIGKIEELFSELDDGIKQLKKTKEQIKTYRQAVLKAAFEGKLTNENVKDGELPESWEVSLIKELVKEDKHALKAGPFGSSLKKEFYVEKGFKIYGQEQVINDDPYFGDYYVDNNKYEELKSCRIKPFDVLISLVGTVGKVLILPEDCQEGIINPRLIKISLDTKIYLPKFFKYYFESSSVKSMYSAKTRGTTMDVLNLGIIKTITFPVPPIKEQEQVISEIEKRFSVADKLEESINKSLLQAEAMRQSILKKAFEGKLVPQDPNDEPADKLLERIKN